MSNLFSGHYQQATITTISIVALIALSVMVWFVYAYFFPHSWSGQLLIKVTIWNDQYFLLCTEDHIMLQHYLATWLYLYFHFSTVHQDGNGEEESLDILQHPYTCKLDQTRSSYDIRKPNNLNLKTTHDKKTNLFIYWNNSKNLYNTRTLGTLNVTNKMWFEFVPLKRH